VSINKTLFDRIGGKSTLMRVHKLFYDKAYAHPWLSQYFTDKPQDILESQQTEFMGQLFGGPKAYAGKTPKMAHQHMMISDELFDVRAQLLKESLSEAGLADDLQQEWLAADGTFKRARVKESEGKCARSYPAQPILNFSRPAGC